MKLAGRVYMADGLKDKRIQGVALEMIMRDVLDGMVGFTHEACMGSMPCDMEILSVERPPRGSQRPAAVIPFPGRKRAGRN
jgi:hypothetical protein